MMIELENELAESLVAKAKDRGLTLEQYLRAVIRAPKLESPNGHFSMQEFEKILDEFAAGAGLPLLPPEFSRPDIYHDHE